MVLFSLAQTSIVYLSEWEAYNVELQASLSLNILNPHFKVVKRLIVI
jgi:hypothetical protein